MAEFKILIQVMEIYSMKILVFSRPEVIGNVVGSTSVAIIRYTEVADPPPDPIFGSVTDVTLFLRKIPPYC